jgi:hypothetical protein
MEEVEEEVHGQPQYEVVSGVAVEAVASSA